MVGVQALRRRESDQAADCGQEQELRVWCRRRDLNPHGLRHTPLKRACLPFHHFGTLERRLERLLPSCSRRSSRKRRLSHGWSLDAPGIMQQLLLQTSGEGKATAL